MLRIPSAALAKLPPYPPQGRDFPLKPRHHLQNCWRNCPAAKRHGSTPPGRGGGAHRLRDERPANCPAAKRHGSAPPDEAVEPIAYATGGQPTAPRARTRIKDGTGRAPPPSEQATGHWGRQSAYPNARFPTPMWPQCGLACPNATPGAREGALRARRAPVDWLPSPQAPTRAPPRPQIPRSSDIHHSIPPDLRHASQKDYMSLVSMARYSPCPSRKNSTPR